MIPGRQSTDNLSPREKLKGKKLDFKRDLRVEFGQYVQAKTPNKISNSTNERTEGCIALFPRDTATGSVEFLNLATLQVVTRDQWTELPIPDIVIKRMNDLATGQKRKLSKDPVFTVGNRIVAAEADDEDELPLPAEPATMIEIEDNDDHDDDINEEEAGIAGANHRGETEINEDNTHEEAEEVVEENQEGEAETNDEEPEAAEDIPTTSYYDEDYGIETNVDEDGDVIMDDADAVFELTSPPEATPASTTPNQANMESDARLQNQPYNLRENRSNWRSRVFMTAMSKLSESKVKYNYHRYCYWISRILKPSHTSSSYQRPMDRAAYT